jgi:hypothetical protein
MERIRPIPDSQRIANSLKRLLLEDSDEIAGIQKSQHSETSATFNLGSSNIFLASSTR